jgi:putative transposase
MTYTLSLFILTGEELYKLLDGKIFTYLTKSDIDNRLKIKYTFNMKLRYNYRLYPTQLQEENMRQTAGNSRWIWNYFLTQNKLNYELYQKFIFYNQMSTELTNLKKENIWLCESYAQVLQAKLRDLDSALKVKKYNKGFPKYKSKWNSNDSFRYIQNTSIINNKYLRLHKIGDVEIRLHRNLPKYSSVAIYQNAGKWFASFVIDVQEQSKVNITNSIGIDVNANNITDSIGQIHIAPRPNRKYKKKLKYLRRLVSRKQKKSKNKAKAMARLKRFMAHIRNIRKDFLHQVSVRIAKAATLVCAETLDIEQMKKNHYVAVAIEDNGWASLFNLIEYKTKLLGHHFHQINQWLASSKTCHNCGCKKMMPPGIDIYECDNPDCDWICNRDINAALNIDTWGRQELKLKPGPERTKVLLDVMYDVLSSDGISSTQMKEENTSR